MNISRIAKNLFKKVTWRLSTFGLQVTLFYIVKENTDAVSAENGQEVKITSYNTDAGVQGAELDFTDLKERKLQLEGWFKMQEPVFIAYIEEKMVGFLTIKTRDIKIFEKRLSLAGNYYYLNYVYVSQKYRGRAIAGLLRNHAFAEMKKQSDGFCVSYIDAMNAPAIVAARKTGAQMITMNAAVIVGRFRKKILFNRRLYSINT